MVRVIYVDVCHIVLLVNQLPKHWVVLYQNIRKPEQLEMRRL